MKIILNQGVTTLLSHLEIPEMTEAQDIPEMTEVNPQL